MGRGHTRSHTGSWTLVVVGWWLTTAGLDPFKVGRSQIGWHPHGEIRSSRLDPILFQLNETYGDGKPEMVERVCARLVGGHPNVL
jgi:hypothetical protein